MTGLNTKFMIGEQAGVEFGYLREYLPDSGDIKYETIPTQSETQAIAYAKVLTMNAASSSGGLISIGVGTNQAAVLSYYQGSAVFTSPVRTRFIISSGNGGNVTVRLQDITNNLTIATASTTSTTPVMLTATPSNIPTGGAIIQVQLTVTGVLNTGNFYFASLEFI